MVKNPLAVQETQVRSLGHEEPLEKGMATHFSILAWEIPWTEEAGGLQSTGSQRLGHDWVTNTQSRHTSSSLAASKPWDFNHFGVFLSHWDPGFQLRVEIMIHGAFCVTYVTLRTCKGMWQMSLMVPVLHCLFFLDSCPLIYVWLGSSSL